MIYVFCGAYKALMFALYLKSLGKEITVLTHNEDIIKYCAEENIKCIKFELVRPKFTSFYKVFKLKKVLDEVIKKIDFHREDEFFLTGKSMAYDSFYLAKEISKKGVVYYKNPDRELKKYKPPRFKSFFIRGYIVKLMLKFVLDLDLIYYDTHEDPRFGIDDDFLNKCGIKEYAPTIPAEKLILEGIKNYQSNYKEYDNFIVDDGLLIGYVKIDSMINLYKKLFDLPLKFAFKKHPNLGEEEAHPDSYYSFYKNFKDCDEIPKYIPAELLYNNIRKNVISVCSNALITASQLQHLKAISLLDIVEWFDESNKKYFKDYLIKESKKKIIFPQSFSELKRIISDS